MPEETKKYLKSCLKGLIDPNKIFYNKEPTEMTKPIKVVAIHNTDFDNNSRGMVFDPILEDFVIGSAGIISKWELEQDNVKHPLVIRGLARNSQQALKYCQENNIDYYAIDTGYMQVGTRKDYHRVTKNALQNLGPIIDRPTNRLEKLNWEYRQPRPGQKILICPPSEKVMSFYNLDLNQWLSEVIDEIKSRTNRPIEIRKKPPRADRVSTNTIWQALENTYCLVTFNSIAATEATLYSVPAIALAPNAASVICNTDLDSIKNPYIPTKKEIERFAAHLSYCQFTKAELRTGYAWGVINENS